MDHDSQAIKPTVYIVHGDDPLSIKRFIDSMVEKMGDPSIADLNITRLDGRNSSEDDLRSSANAMPFMAERRLVIVTHPLARLTTDAARKRYRAMLDSLPDTTALVLVIEDSMERGKWKSLIETHWLRKWATQAGERAFLKECRLPPVNRMADWIREEARREGGQFTPEAAAALVTHVANDTQLASQEIRKLLTYVDCKRPVEVEDIEELTAQGGQADVFVMVDAMASGSAKSALGLLHRLLEEQEPLTLFGMIVRQFRLLVQTRELLDEGLGSNVARDLHLPSFVADKLAAQARRFTMPQLENIYRRLLDMDEMMKTGQIPADLALDTFIAELAK